MFTLLATAKLAIQGAHKLVELHEAGVDKKVVEEIHESYQRIHDLVAGHHDQHVAGSDQEEKAEPVF